MIKLKERFEKICDEYLLEFCNRHEYRIYPDPWVSNLPGGIADINDMFVSFDDIRYDVDNNIPVDTFEKWYWRSLDVYEVLGYKYMNYCSYCKGCPEPEGLDRRLQHVRELKSQITKEINELSNL